MYGLVWALIILGVIGAVVFIAAVVNSTLSRRRADRLSGVRDAQKLKAALRQCEELAINAQSFEPVLATSILREVRKVT